MSANVRVAAVQFGTGTDVDANLRTTLRMIDRAAAEAAPQVMVLPEFCNHLSVYDDGDHACRVAIDLDGPWVAAIAAKAAEHRCWIQVNCTVRRSGESTSREPAPGRVTNTNLVFSPAGELAAANDKTVLMGAEGDFLSVAEAPATMIDTPFGRVGTYACMDGVVPEVPRGVALRGAQLMLNSLNSFALDEASLHIPVRAAENKCWVVACCKSGPLLPADKVELFSSMMGVPAEFLDGAGESQIVAPDGSIVAMGPREGEAVVWADIDLAWSDDKRRPDGTDVMASRRPAAYAALAEPTPPLDDHVRADVVGVAVAHDLDQVAASAADGALLIVMPELAMSGRAAPGAAAADVAHAADAVAVDAVAAIAAALVASEAVVVTSVRDGDAHVGVAIDSNGLVGRQLQLHPVARHAEWQRTLGDSVDPIDLPWGRVAIVVGDDLVYPESSRLAALASVDLIAVPFAQQEEWETRLGLPERAAENRVCLVAANSIGDSLIVDLPPDFTLWAPSRERVFDGTINRPDVTVVAAGEAGSGVVHPSRSVNRQISKGTNLVDGRPWQLGTALVASTP